MGRALFWIQLVHFKLILFRSFKDENINVVNKKEFLSIAAEMSQTLHSAYQKNIEGE